MREILSRVDDNDLTSAVMSRFFRQAGDSDSDTEESEEELLTSGDEEAPQKTAAKPTGMSRFLRTAGSDSSSSSEPESESEEEEIEPDTEKKKGRFLRSDSDDEESEDEGDVKRVVKSSKDKRLEEIEATGKAMDNALKINDWVAISAG